MHGLHELGIKEDTLSKFMRLHVHPTDNNYALDIRHSSIIVSNLSYLFRDYIFDNSLYETVFLFFYWN